jgi:GDPmannose 4,6-dehydratase
LKDVYEDHTIYNRRLFLHYADLEDTTALRRILQRVQPDELYHLAGQSHVGLSFEIPETTCELTAVATLRLLEILRDLPRIPSWFTLAAAKFSASQRLRAPARPSIFAIPK